MAGLPHTLESDPYGRYSWRCSKLRDDAMAKKKQPENVEWIVTMNVETRGSTAIVHAKDKDEALRKANAMEIIGELDHSGAETVDWKATHVEANTDQS